MEAKKNIKQETDFSLQTRNFGERLKKARQRLGLSTLEASKILGIEKNSYYKYEDASRFPKPEILLSIMTNFNLNINYLLSGEGEMFIDKKEKEADLQRLFPELSIETFPLIEDLQVPVMKHSLMTHYLVEREKFKVFIDNYFEEKKKKYTVRKKREENE